MADKFVELVKNDLECDEGLFKMLRQTYQTIFIEENKGLKEFKSALLDEFDEYDPEFINLVLKHASTASEDISEKTTDNKSSLPQIFQVFTFYKDCCPLDVMYVRAESLTNLIENCLDGSNTSKLGEIIESCNMTMMATILNLS